MFFAKFVIYIVNIILYKRGFGAVVILDLIINKLYIRFSLWNSPYSFIPMFSITFYTHFYIIEKIYIILTFICCAVNIMLYIFTNIIKLIMF